MTVAPVRNRRRRIWTDEYELAHCEGYRVATDDANVGFVEGVVRCPAGATLALRIRTGSEHAHHTIVIGDVLELDASGERIVIRSTPR